MKYIKFRFFSLLTALLTAVISFSYSAEQSAQIRGIRTLGMGGAFVGIADDQNAVFYNPAGLTQRTGSQLTIFELPIGISEDIFNFYSYYQDNADKLRDFDTLGFEDKSKIITDISGKITKYKPRLRLGFPNTSYLSGPGFLSWGLGLFTQADLGFQLNSGILIPNISFWGTVDVIGAVPLAHRFDELPYNVPGKISVGATLKYINRARISEFNKSILEFENFDPLLQMGNGYGLDLGTLYQPDSRWNVGFSVTDFGGTAINFARIESTKSGEVKPASVGIIYPRWNIGTAYIPSKFYYWPGKSINTKDRLVLSADIDDIFNTEEPLFDATFFKKLHLGAEIKWAIFALRGGFNSGYPTMGFGINLYLLQLDYAFWGDELGRYAGQIPEWNHQLNISMRFGQNKGRAWGRTSSKQPQDKAIMQEQPAQEPQVTQPTAVETKQEIIDEKTPQEPKAPDTKTEEIKPQSTENITPENPEAPQTGTPETQKETIDKKDLLSQ
ncbi:MAG TPA: hypothetical protein DEE98_05535 [Elusimicrobia bacterium]|nr:MAG: hypothetical protein A2278_01630 [Elusimicrobia bacterium RIFOXYA12_FULL_49_49]OGS16749.1 MAG: hypothetical protein A2251_05080 [Elusimicrobia bacterium RIFOXYA2_FULL_47_53]OGS27030.1 MAG: hypothetical protein A2339_04935 [Elusimicrobia bacterium RIFOXYB12_FULL_50_12]OGS31977.1 MAG: hypothetical protein A2323_07855 [Elusimicrobia bacterium RIFOXYB2_FULL_46_23]HBU69829.1 hypothetical protein [Elusimicrobiota bacterium]